MKSGWLVLGLSFALMSLSNMQADESVRYMDSNPFCSSNRACKVCNYLRLGGGLNTPSSCDEKGQRQSILVGVGHRRIFDCWAIDLSAQGGNRYFAAPRIQGLRYLRGSQGWTAYLGGGLSWGEVANFTGLMAEGTIGVDLATHSPFVLFIEGTASQPILSTRGGSTLCGPALFVSMGVGF